MNALHDRPIGGKIQKTFANFQLTAADIQKADLLLASLYDAGLDAERVAMKLDCVATALRRQFIQLYTDQDEVLFACRPIILNGIEDCIGRPDLADRAVFLALEAIPEKQRKLEKELMAEFSHEQPRILGALLDAVSHGLRELPKVHLDRLPRMAAPHGTRFGRRLCGRE